MQGTKIVAIAAALLLAALIGGAVLLGTTDAETTHVNPAHLVVGPGPPRTATGVVTFTNTEGLVVTATCAFDFVHHAAGVSATATLSIASFSLEARLVGPVLALNVPAIESLTGAPWVATTVPGAPRALDRLATELRHVDVARLHADRASVTTTGTTSTTTMWFDHVHLPSTTGLPITLPKDPRVTLSVTSGAQGQLLRAAATMVGTSDTVGVALLMTGYNQPVRVAAPPSHQTVPLTATRVRQIFGTNAPAMQHWLNRAAATTP